MRNRLYRIVMGTALAALLAGCEAAPVKINSSGSIPSGPGASFMLTQDDVDPAWLSADDITRCLIGRGMQPSATPAYLVQYAVAVRPAANTVLTGDQTAKPARLKGRDKRGDRIVYHLIIDGLQNQQRTYSLSVDAPYKAKQASIASRAAMLCSALDRKAG